MAQPTEPANLNDSVSGLSAADHRFEWEKSYPPHVSWDTKFSPRLLTEMFDEAVEKYQSQVCTYFLGKTLSYRQIGDMAARAAAGLQRMGLQKGQRVGLFLPNCPTFIVYYFAILKAGGVVVNYNPLYSHEELKHQIEDSETTIMVTLDLKQLFDKVEGLLADGALSQSIVCRFAELLPPVKSALFRGLKFSQLSNPSGSAQRHKITLQGDLMTEGPLFQAPDLTPEDVAVLQYTGGTTGVPKGAMLSHANLSINQQQILAWQNIIEEGQETFMGILPLFHVFAMTTVMNLGVLSGGRLILIPKFELNEGLKIISRLKPTIMPGVPTLYNAINNHPKLASFDLSSLKFCISGGAALPIEVKRKFELLTGCDLVEGYGLSETSPVATCNPIDGTVKDGSIGIPFPQTTISIRSLDDPTEALPLSENGEICISGPQVMQGYWNKPEATQAAFVGDFFRTGDVGHMDDEGFIFIVDRIKDLIICSGFNVYPRRIEEAIYELPAVDEVTVIGIPDQYRGECPKAFIKLKDGHSLSADEVMAFLRPKLSKLEMPSEIEFRQELPKTMVGKLSKKELRDEK